MGSSSVVGHHWIGTRRLRRRRHIDAGPSLKPLLERGKGSNDAPIVRVFGVGENNLAACFRSPSRPGQGGLEEVVQFGPVDTNEEISGQFKHPLVVRPGLLMAGGAAPPADVLHRRGKVLRQLLTTAAQFTVVRVTRAIVRTVQIQPYIDPSTRCTCWARTRRLRPRSTSAAMGCLYERGVRRKR